MNRTEQELRQEILALIEHNARMDVRKIAERLGVPTAVVSRLIEEMEADRTILGYYTLLNEEKPQDARVRAVIEVAVRPERDGGFDRIAHRICRFPEVRTVYLVSGQSDLRIEVSGATMREVAGFVASKLAPIDGVRSTVTHFLLKKYKEAGVFLDEEEDYERLKIVP